MPEKEILEIGLSILFDPDEHNGMEARNFLYHFLTRINREAPIVAVEYKGDKREFAAEDSLASLPLRQVDSINEKDIPKPLDTKQVTRLPEKTEVREARVEMDAKPDDEKPTNLDF